VNDSENVKDMATSLKVTMSVALNHGYCPTGMMSLDDDDTTSEEWECSNDEKKENQGENYPEMKKQKISNIQEEEGVGLKSRSESQSESCRVHPARQVPTAPCKAWHKARRLILLKYKN
jgi:hypothetical protein